MSTEPATTDDAVDAAPTPSGDPVDGDTSVSASPPDPAPPAALVEWEATARRLRRSSVVLLTAAVVAWSVGSLVAGSWSVGTLGNWLGLALGAMFVVELVVVGGSAVRGMLRAGERGERLSSHDVGLVPPRRRPPEPRD